MTGFWYQIKNIRRDKLCILTFLLPVIAGLGLHLLPGMNLTALSEPLFGVICEELPSGTETWLRGIGKVTVYKTENEMRQDILEPSTQMIGVRKDGQNIRTIISGDELSLNRKIAGLLPKLEQNRQFTNSIYDDTQSSANPDLTLSILPAEDNRDTLLSLLAAITMVTAMFMGCTFNAMSLIKEKEDGINFINEILPITQHQYLLQKILLGFLGGILSATITAWICIKPQVSQMPFLLLLILLSTFLAALTGLFIGHFSRELMAGIVMIKAVMILFIAPPILFYLTLPADSSLYTLTCLLPSSAAFYGLMDLLTAQALHPLRYIFPLVCHCAAWSLVFVFIKRKKLSA